MKVLPGIVADEIDAMLDDVKMMVSDLSSEFNFPYDQMMARVIHRLMESGNQ